MKVEDSVHIELARLVSTQNVMQDCLFGALAGLLPKDQFHNLQVNYYLRLQKQIEKALNAIDFVDSGALTRAKFEAFSATQANLRDLGYDPDEA